METRGGKTGRHDENSGDGMPRFKTNSRLELAANGFSIADIFNWIASSPLDPLNLKIDMTIKSARWPNLGHEQQFLKEIESKIVPFPRNGCENGRMDYTYIIYYILVHRMNN